MTEIWLRPNRRAFLPGLIFCLAGALACAGIGAALASYWFILWPAIVVAGLWLIVAAAFGWQMTTPRMAYENGHLNLHLRGGQPFRIPIDIVEVFFFGQGDTSIPGIDKNRNETASIVVRLAESAEDWKQRDVHPNLGAWCDGYITVRGDWTEPITEDLLRRLNARLAEIHRERKEASKS